MQTDFDIQPKASGTTIGATLSLLLIVAFGFSSILSHQKDIQHNASQHNTQTVAVKAYLA